MSSNYSKNSTDLYYKLYGSNPTEQIKEPKELAEPEILYLENKIDKEIDNKNGKIENDVSFEAMSKLLNESASKYEIIKNILYLGNEEDKTNANFISELDNSFIIISTYDKHLILYNENYKKILKIKFPLPINSFNELKSKENNNIIRLICCSVYSVYELSLDLINKEVKIEKCIFSQNLKEEKGKENKENIDDECEEKKCFNYHYMLKLNNNKELLCTNHGVYEGNNILNKEENNQEPILFKQYTELVALNNRFICFKSNNQLSKGEDSLTIFEMNDKKIINKINGYSFSISPYKLILLSHNEKNKTLICGCTKYSSEQKNGILIVNFDLFEEESIKTNIKFEETESFNLNCICYLKNKNKENNNREGFLLAGGVDNEYNEGLIKMFKIKCDENNINVEYLQDLELDDSIRGNISYIYQLKNGKIIISCENGNYLFTEPNLEGYLEDLDDA